MSDLSLLVNGIRYGGWKSVRVTRSIESISGSFELEASDRWGGQDVPWPIMEEDACRVEIDGAVVIDGFIDKRSIALSADARTLSYSGRDGAGILVDCSIDLDKWTFRNASVFDIAKKVAEPFGIAVSMQSGLVLPKPQAKIVVSPGDAAFEVIANAARSAGVLLVSDGAGGILITRAGTSRATSLVQGQNIKSASVDYDASPRFRRYEVRTQTRGTDGASGDATRISGYAVDEGVRRVDRILLVRTETGVTADYAQRRADWEARNRAARAETVTIGVLGWKQPNGLLWPINALCRVSALAIGVDGDMLISQVEHSISDGGEVTKLSLVRPDAFTPEPTAVVKDPSGSGGWKELNPSRIAIEGVDRTLVGGIVDTIKGGD